jgi:hypothetical protein
MKKFETVQDVKDWILSIPKELWGIGSINNGCRKCIIGHLGANHNYELEGVNLENAIFIYNLYLSNYEALKFMKLGHLKWIQQDEDSWNNLWRINDFGYDFENIQEHLINCLPKE